VVIPNSLRAAALDRVFSEQQQKARIPEILFNFAVNQAPPVLAMESWQPFALEYLNLSGQCLSRAHLGSFKLLIELNLSDNQISSLHGMGLEQCQRLQRLALSNNQLTSADNYISIQPLIYLQSLRELWLSGNPGLGSREKYTDLVIQLLSNLRGDLHSPGLQMLNNQSISIDDRIRALKACGGGEHEHAIRLHLNLVAIHGHRCVARADQFYPVLRKL
jgi:Leucine-rich repeat (LRR) protein